jgi:FKBP-type peptidyl-prolyl cis-trans isomerase FkpA
MTARFLIAFAAATVLFGVNVPQAVRADAPTPHCSLDRAHALERQGRGEAAGSGASFARAVDHLRAASGEYALCAVQASGGAARLALWQQAQAALRAAETPELQVGTPHDVDALIAGVRNYDAAIADDRTIPRATRSLALTRFVAACVTASQQGDENAREAACKGEYAAVAASRNYLALTPGYHEILAAPTVAATPAMPSADKMIALPDGLRYTDTVIGTGAEAKFGQHVSMQYVGTMSDGTVFDSSRSRSTPFDFTIGTGTVIECWDEGVIGMRVGGHRTLVCPPSIGYGGNRQGTIPPYSTLHFDLELVSVQP